MTTESRQFARANDALGQVIANSFFAMQAGQEWDAEGPLSYDEPKRTGGDMQLAFDILRSGWLAAHDREVAAKALRDAAERFVSEGPSKAAVLAHAARIEAQP